MRPLEGRTDGILVAHLQREAHILRRLVIDQRRAVAEGVGGVGDHRQFSVIDLDQRGGVARLRLCFGDHHGNALADEADPVVRQRPARRTVALRPAHVLRHHAGHQRTHAVSDIVLAGQHGDDTRSRRRGARVDTTDVGMRHRREDENRVGHARQHDVVDILAATGEEFGVFLAMNRLPDAKTHVALPGANFHAAAGVCAP